ncbi:Rab GTPase [Dictyostelium purpureum]|uniref:Ras-related protein Rab n=1 Tax=Dictyostelium purpureum TaxID=5786 RepID=F0Z8I7_DICPU|nr:Rab GTPase [Dictyostelium purpureum]EGC39733.1 Rab GTPase [Dictyostelium purpureum]|eukprot:XP_003283719.1 Rab GTPase [Dictyostelium purpureum]
MANNPADDEEYNEYKILVVGDIGTGKTSITRSLVYDTFSKRYNPTIGVDFGLKVINWDPKTEVRLQLWDISGSERLSIKSQMTRVYYNNAVGAMITFDVTGMSTFKGAAIWKAGIDQVTNDSKVKPIPVVLLANKWDLVNEGKDSFIKTENDMDKYCKDNGFIGWFKISAKDNMNIEKAARFLVDHILKNDNPTL